MSTEFLNILEENGRIIAKLVRIYGNKNNDQQDLYQEIVYPLWKSYSSFRGEAKISTWIYRVALNTSLAHGKLKKKHAGNVPLQDRELEDTTDTKTDEKTAQMYRQIGTLNEIDKAIIFLFLEGNRCEEIALITGFTVSNVGRRLNRIKQKLKNQLLKH
jgi:RNA polymerase sigma-70 factor (ECF subfamily)